MREGRPSAPVSEAPDRSVAARVGLPRLDGLTRSHAPAVRFVKWALRDVPQDAPVTILHLDAGDGGLLRTLARRLRHRPNCRLIGYASDPGDVTAAAAPGEGDARIGLRYGDATRHEGRIDLILASRVGRRLDAAGIVALLRWMEARAVRGWFVTEPYRGMPAVRRGSAETKRPGLRRRDWERLIARAWLDRGAIELRWHAPFHLCIGRAA